MITSHEKRLRQGVMGKINSRAKGVKGELELAEFLRDHGIHARRGQQFAGGSDSPDVVSSLTSVHLECKRVEAGNPYLWLDQATRDAGHKIPVVAHRRSRRQWVVILNLDDFLNFIVPHGDKDAQPTD